MRRFYLAAFLLIFLVLLSAIPAHADSVSLYHVTGAITIPGNTACQCQELIDFSFDYGVELQFISGSNYWRGYVENIAMDWNGPLGTFQDITHYRAFPNEQQQYIGLSDFIGDELDIHVVAPLYTLAIPQTPPTFQADLYSCYSPECIASFSPTGQRYNVIVAHVDAVSVPVSESPTSVLLLIAGMGILPFGAKRFLREGF